MLVAKVNLEKRMELTVRIFVFPAVQVFIMISQVVQVLHLAKLVYQDDVRMR